MSTSDNRQGPWASGPHAGALDAMLGGEAARLGGDAGRQDVELAGSDRQGSEGGRALRVLALIAVTAGLAGVTAAACVLSYSRIHQLAIQAGVHGRLASVYPLIFDALLVVAGCSVLALRGAGLVSRVYSWLCMLVLLAALAAGGAARAAAVTIPRKTAAVVAAIVPWALVLLGFGLLLALLRYLRLRRAGRGDDEMEGGASYGADEMAEAEAAAASGSPDIAVAAVAGRLAAARELAASPGLEAAGQAPGSAGRAAASAPAERGPEEAYDADASSGGSGVEPPAVPGAAVPTQQAPAAEDRAAASGAAGSSPDSGAPGQDAGTGLRPGVRHADLQLRARIPKQPAHDPAKAQPAPPGWPNPFMPKVGQQTGEAAPSPAAQEEGAGQHEPGGQATADETTATALPRRVPGQQPVTSGLQPAAAAPTSPRSPSDQASDHTEGSGDAGETAAGEPDASAPGPTLSAAPTHDDSGADASGLPAFRRTHATPTPPQGDDLAGDEPRGDEPREDDQRN